MGERGTMRKTKEEAKKTRIKILTAAEALFYKQGVALSTLEQIAAKADLTRGAVYWHFKSKKEVCDALAVHSPIVPPALFEEFSSQIATLDPLRALEKISQKFLKLFIVEKRSCPLLSLLAVHHENIPEIKDVASSCGDCMQNVLAWYQKFFSRAKELKQLAPLWTPQTAAISLGSLIIGLVVASDASSITQTEKLSTGTKCLKAFLKSLRQNVI